MVNKVKIRQVEEERLSGYKLIELVTRFSNDASMCLQSRNAVLINPKTRLGRIPEASCSMNPIGDKHCCIITLPMVSRALFMCDLM